MSAHHPSDIPALDELGRRFAMATASPQRSAPRRRRVLLVAAIGCVVLLATPSLASISGVFNSHSNIEEALPRAAAVIEPDDPAGTGRALHRLGIGVRWSLVEDNPGGTSPTQDRDVAAPPPGTEILSVTAYGAATITEDTRILHIEVAPTNSRILQSHR